MKLSELLDHVSVHVLDDRTAMLNGSPDALWSDEVLTRYFRTAEDIFCRKAWVLKDNVTASCCSITLVANQKDYPLHSSVLRVLSAKPNDSDIDLIPMTYDGMRPRLTPTGPDHFDVNVSYVDTPGRPYWFATDIATRILRVRPTPDTAAVTAIGTLNLRVARLPLVALAHTLPDNEPEIPDEYHLDLCDYVAGKALSHPNADGEAASAAKDYLKMFFASVRSARGDIHVAEAAQPNWYFGGWANS